MFIQEGKYYLYRHIRLDKNEVFYVGLGTKTKDDIQYNTYSRATKYHKHNKYWYNIVNITEYKVEILFESNDYQFIKQKEIEFIKLYGKTKNGGTLCNITDGGDGTLGFSRTPEINKIIAFKTSGKNNKLSVEIYQYDLNGNFITSHESVGQTAKNTGFCKQNIQESKKSFVQCNGFYFYNKKLLPNEILSLFKKEIKERKGRTIGMYDLNNNFIQVFTSIDKAEKLMSNNKYRNIKHCLSGKNLTAYKHKWKYLDK